ncbi:MAG TPA: fibronectin type III domain-containing protein, partial [Thermomicrobiales bacterium]|nr:fibronectin type III domain-containing protein [Thermomicrobiales bacterium]
ISITIGANDFHFGDSDNFLQKMYWQSDSDFTTWANDVIGSASQNLGITLAALLGSDPNTAVVVTELYNPFNRQSIFFKSLDLDGEHCVDKSCFVRTEHAVTWLNAEYQRVIDGYAKRFPGRVALASVQKPFGQHRAPEGKAGSNLAECGHALPTIADTWIQYPTEAGSNSFPWKNDDPADWTKAFFLGADWRSWKGDCVHPNPAGAQAIANAANRTVMGKLKLAALVPPPPQITAGPSVEIVGAIANINWTTDRDADGEALFGLTTQTKEHVSEGGSPGTQHHVALSGLQSGKTYYYRVQSSAAGGTTTSARRSFAMIPACPSDQSLCGSNCRDLTTDAANCGACGHACLAIQSCAAGRCLAQCTVGDPGCVAISSTQDWQDTGITFQQGDQFMVAYVSGTWTVDYRFYAYVGPEGHPPDVDAQINPACKIIDTLPYGRLLGVIGNGSIFSVGAGGAFTADDSGELFLTINDICRLDNDGSVVMLVASAVAARTRAKGTTTSTSVLSRRAERASQSPDAVLTPTPVPKRP